MVAHWYSAPDFFGRGPGFEFRISHNNPDALQDHCVLCNKPGAKNKNKKIMKNPLT